MPKYRTCICVLAISLAACLRAQVVSMDSVMVKGTVYDADGKPASGVRMIIEPGTNEGILTDTDGTYTLPWRPGMFGGHGPYFLVGRDKGMNLAAAHVIDEKATNMDLHLAPGIKITGSVQDPNAKGIGKASVRLIMEFPNFSTQGGVDPATTDASGAFEFKTLPGDYLYILNVSAQGYGRYSHVIGQALEDNLRLQPIILKPADKLLAGSVLDTDDKPAAGAMVSVSDGDVQPAVSTICDALGRFELKVCEGNVKVSASLPQFQMGARMANLGTANVEGGDTNVIIKIGVDNYFETIKKEANTGPG